MRCTLDCIGMEVKDAIKFSLDLLESKGAVWRTGKGSRANLEAALNNLSLPLHEAAGYSATDGIRHAFTRALETCSIKKEERNKKWRDWIFFIAGTYYCNSCSSLVSLDQVAINCGRCKACDSKKSKSRSQDNRKKIVEYLKSNHCVDCGESDPVVLEFDHTDPTKKIDNISNMVRRSWELIKKEIDKCDVVCANCHRRRTAKQFNWYNW